MIVMKARTVARAAFVVFLVAGLTACGGSRKSGTGPVTPSVAQSPTSQHSDRHTYIVRPSVNGVPIGADLTIVSTVAFPQSLLDREKKGAIFVHHAVGPQACSSSKKMAGAKGKYAYLNGKPVTLKVNGSNKRVTSIVCSFLRKHAFNPVPSQGLVPASP